MTSQSEVRQFILLPAQGLRSDVEKSSPVVVSLLTKLHNILLSGSIFEKFNVDVLPARFYISSTPMEIAQPSRFSTWLPVEDGPRHAAMAPIPMNVLDSIHEDGAKLVELTPQAVSEMRAAHPGVKILPIIYYEPARAPRPAPRPDAKIARAIPPSKTRIIVTSQIDGSPIAGATVIVFTDFTRRIGEEQITDSEGSVEVTVEGVTASFERVYVYPIMGFWNYLQKNITIESELHIEMLPIDLSYIDSLRHFYGRHSQNRGEGVTVGIIDTGVSSHPDLTVQGGANMLIGEDPLDFSDSNGHGTHVAGIIAANGVLGGVAPGVELRAYRAFGKDQKRTTNFVIIKALDQAVADGCDIINMSLTTPMVDQAMSEAIAAARARGSIVIAAAGNDSHAPVGYPAADPLAIGVSAFGRNGTFPENTTESGEIAAPYGTDKDNFIAGFSNIGSEIDLTGPGVGIISTVPGGYTVISGTSMACPAATGMAARLFSEHPEILQMERNQLRSDSLVQLLLQNAESLGFGAIFEGYGLL